MSKLSQIFYGRGKDGYGVLGASPSGRPFSDSVAALCRAVGSPDRPGDIQPFLISKRESNSVIMIRACRGDADPTGRSTLFFHALVAPVEVLSSANLDAFVLAENGVFLSTLSKSVEDIEVSASTGQSCSSPSDGLCFPAFVSSDRPLDAEVRRALGREKLTRNWATYSYRPLDGFDLCVHSSYASSPVSGNRYTFANGRFMSVDEPLIVVQNSQPTSRKKESSPLLKASLFANVVLAIVLVVVLAMGNGNDNEEQPSKEPSVTQAEKSDNPNPVLSPEMTGEDAFEKWGKEWESEFRQKLCKAFDKRLGGNKRIQEFDEVMIHICPFYSDVKKPNADPSFKEVLSRLDSLEAYVSFVEDEIITTKQERKRNEHDKSKR